MGKRVKLVSFNGELTAPADCHSDENYWRLIGQTGVIIGQNDDGSRVLIKFDRSVSSFGLASHNPVANSLYILPKDLSDV